MSRLLALLAVGMLGGAATGPPQQSPQPPPLPRQALDELVEQAENLEPAVLERALAAADCALRRGLADTTVLSVIDYSLPSTRPRLWTFDLETRELLFEELVAHGKNTGENRARYFSNRLGSKQSSLGLFRTAEAYMGRNGYSLRLDGLEADINHLARPRTIVLHGAWYVSPVFAARHGRLGRSWGCPAVRAGVARRLIKTIKEGSLLFIYYPDEEWLAASSFLNACDEME